MFGSSTSSSLLGLTPLGSPWHIGDWNILAHHGFFLSGHAYDVSVLGLLLLPARVHGRRPRRSRPARWPSAGSSARSACGACSRRCSCIRSSATGCGAVAGSRSSARSVRSGATAPSTSPAAVSCTRWAASPPSGAPRCSAPASASTTRTASPRAIPGHHIPMAFLGTFVLLVGWMGFNGASTFAGTDFRLTVVIVNTILASAFGCLSGDVHHVEAVRQARPVDDGQRPARRPRRHHRAVRLRRAVGRRASSASSPACSWSRVVLVRRAHGQGRRPRRCGRRARRQRPVGPASPSGCSPTAPTAPGSTVSTVASSACSPSTADRPAARPDHRLRRARRRGAASPASSSSAS